MESEVEEFLKKSLKKKTFIDKIKRKLLLLNTADTEIDKMREQLIKEAKPIFENFHLTVKNEDRAFSELLIEHFDERIRSLP